MKQFQTWVVIPEFDQEVFTAVADEMSRLRVPMVGQTLECLCVVPPWNKWHGLTVSRLGYTYETLQSKWTEQYERADPVPTWQVVSHHWISSARNAQNQIGWRTPNPECKSCGGSGRTPVIEPPSRWTSWYMGGTFHEVFGVYGHVIPLDELHDRRWSESGCVPLPEAVVVSGRWWEMDPQADLPSVQWLETVKRLLDNAPIDSMVVALECHRPA